jgi:hypothetical protein
VRAVAGHGVERDGHDGRQRLALAGLHLDDAAVVQRERGDDLHVEGPEPERPPGRVTSQREDLLALDSGCASAANCIANLYGATPDLIVREPGHLRFELIDAGQRPVVLMQRDVDRRTANAGEHVAESNRIPHAPLGGSERTRPTKTAVRTRPMLTRHVPSREKDRIRPGWAVISREPEGLEAREWREGREGRLAARRSAQVGG